MPDAINTSPSVSQIQGAAVAACKYLPTATTVAQLVSSSSSISTAASIAGLICGAVTSIPLADGGSRTPKVNGVVIRGQFVK